MINVKDRKVNDVILGIHEAMLRKAKRGGRSKESIITENRIFSAFCHDFDMKPSKCAAAVNERYGYDLTGDEVIQVLRSRKLSIPSERKEVFEWAYEISICFAEAIAGKKSSYEKYSRLRKEPALRSGKKHDSQDRIAVVMIYERYPEIDKFGDKENLHLLGNTLAKYFFYDISDTISEVYGFPQHKEDKENKKEENTVKKMTNEQAVQKIELLEDMLDRTNTMLQDLQEEFDEQLEASKVKELADFFTRLNSEKYGCILDELLVVRKGVDELRKKNYELPIEINGLLIMVKKLIQFVRDSHIEPIMKINSIREVSASDVEFCSYDGTPFSSPEEKKTVKVVSPGWIYKDKELQISRPKVREEE